MLVGLAFQLIEQLFFLFFKFIQNLCVESKLGLV
jgi:hypothetical protein